MAAHTSSSCLDDQVYQGLLFAGVAYYLSPTLAPDARTGLSYLLETNGAQSVSIKEATHVVSDTDAFDNWRDASKSVHIVTPLWVDRSVSSGVQQSPQFFSPDSKKIFSGIIACSGDVRKIAHGKVIGSLIWVFHIDQSGKYSAPTDQLLHFPVPSWPIEGFPQLYISATNYSGALRDYVKKLLAVTGANWTASLTRRNTQLIAPTNSDHGKKVEKARSWDIAVVNHIWLEDCFLHWKFLTPANEKYIRFPRTGNLAENLGECAVG
ncbi:hypothetical protein AURDEDRAFT_68088, partial [Auricularia subglabra TFB-10046 SS5]